MSKRAFTPPTDAELAILRVLWRRGPSTVREVFDELKDSWPIGYTTVLKFMQIMLEKGLATRDDSARSHIYKANLPQTRTEKHFVSDLLERVFGGDPGRLVMQALSVKKASREELDQIRAYLDRLEDGKP